LRLRYFNHAIGGWGEVYARHRYREKSWRRMDPNNLHIVIILPYEGVPSGIGTPVVEWYIQSVTFNVYGLADRYHVLSLLRSPNLSTQVNLEKMKGGVEQGTRHVKTIRGKRLVPMMRKYGIFFYFMDERGGDVY